MITVHTERIPVFAQGKEGMGAKGERGCKYRTAA